MTWLPHNKFVGKSQSCENALANSQRHSSGTSRSAKRPRANHKPQQDEAECRSSRDALGATRRIPAGDRRFGSAARVAHARARGLDILQNCHGAKSRGRKKKGQRQEGGNTKEESDAPEGRGSATRAKRRGGEECGAQDPCRPHQWRRLGRSRMQKHGHENSALSGRGDNCLT